MSPAQQRRFRRAELGSNAAARTIPSRWQLRVQCRPGDPGVRVSHSRPGGGTHGVGSVHTGSDTGRCSADNRSRQGSHGGRTRQRCPMHSTWRHTAEGTQWAPAEPPSARSRRSTVAPAVPCAQQRRLLGAELGGGTIGRMVPSRLWPCVQQRGPGAPGGCTPHTRPGRGTHGKGSTSIGQDTGRWSADGRDRRGGLTGRARQ